MPKESRGLRIPTPIYGVNNTPNLFSIRDDQVFRAINCRLSADGVLETRKGSRRLNSTALDGAVTSEYEYRRPDGSGYQKIKLVTAGNYLYRWDGTSKTFEKLKELSSSARPCWATFVGTRGGSYAYMCNGTDFYKYDGTFVTQCTFEAELLAALGVRVSAPRYLLVYDDRMFAAGCDTHPHVVWQSNSYDADDWIYNAGDGDDAHYWTMKNYEGDRVTGIGKVYDYGLIFQKNGVTMITEGDVNSDTSKQIIISTKYGTTSHWSIQTIGNVIYFADGNDFYQASLRAAVEEGLEVRPIGKNILNKYRKAKDVDDIISAYDPNWGEIQWCTRNGVGSAKDIIYVYSLRNSGIGGDGSWHDVWSGWFTGIDPNSMGVMTDDDDKPEIWRGDSAGYVYVMYENMQYKDDDSSGTEQDIATEIVTAPIYPSGFSVKKDAKEFIPMLHQRHADSTITQWIVDGSYLKPTTDRSITLYNLIPYWRDDTDTNRAQTWGGTIWTSRAFLIRPVEIMEPFHYIQFRIYNDGDETYDEIAYAGGELTYFVEGVKQL